jgi:hypothetical protein
MVLETTNEGYKNRTGAKFKRFHWWKTIRHHSKWRARSNDPSTMNAFISSSDAAIEEEVVRPIDRDRAKTTAQKRKWKEGLSSQSGSSSSISGIMSTLKKLCTSFTRAQM